LFGLVSGHACFLVALRSGSVKFHQPGSEG